VVTDFDGTIAPIVDDPARAEPLAGAPAVLRRLAARYAVTAVVSGRPVAYLAERLPEIEGLTLAGLYGLQRLQDGRVVEPAQAPEWRTAVDAVTADAHRLAPDGVLVEPKGLTVTLHVRSAPQHWTWIRDFAGEQARKTGLVAHPGRMSVELRPPGGPDKGTVVEELGAGLQAVCFLGDDAGDLAAFEALTRLRSRGADTLAVAVRSPESPPELLEAADRVVEGPNGALRLLTVLADAPPR
jgi:trehalose 6-phosphate phosphatase